MGALGLESSTPLKKLSFFMNVDQPSFDVLLGCLPMALDEYLSFLQH